MRSTWPCRGHRCGNPRRQPRRRSPSTASASPRMEGPDTSADMEMAMSRRGLLTWFSPRCRAHMSGVAYAVPLPRGGAAACQNQSFDDMMIEAPLLRLAPPAGPRERPRSRKAAVVDMLKGKPYIMGHTAELIAQMYNISREDMDAGRASGASNNAERATKEGDFRERSSPSRSPRRRASPRLFRQGRALHAGPHHGQTRGTSAAFIPR